MFRCASRVFVWSVLLVQVLPGPLRPFMREIALDRFLALRWCLWFELVGVIRWRVGLVFVWSSTTQRVPILGTLGRQRRETMR